MPDPRALSYGTATGIGPAPDPLASPRIRGLAPERWDDPENDSVLDATSERVLRAVYRLLGGGTEDDPTAMLMGTVAPGKGVGAAFKKKIAPLVKKLAGEGGAVAGRAATAPVVRPRGLLTRAEKAAAQVAERQARVEALLGVTPETTPSAIAARTKKQGGVSYHLPTGAKPEPGSLMVGKYANTDPRNVVTDLAREPFGPKAVKTMVGKNAEAYQKPDTFYGSWHDPEGRKVYQDVSQRFPPGTAERKAAKFGERTRQKAGYQVGETAETGRTFPIGNWEDFVASPEMRGRMDAMAKVGRGLMGEDDWWKMRGTPFEEIYGIKGDPAANEHRMRQLAGFLASTSPQNPPMRNIQDASEYMRRLITHEPILQPNYRIPATAMERQGGQIFGEANANKANLVKASEGRLADLQQNKVREMGQALVGDPQAVVLDRQHAKLSEKPAAGIYAATEANLVTPGKPYEQFKAVMSKAAAEGGETPRIYSAHVWEGIRDTIRRTGDLFGQTHRASAIPEESQAFFRSFEQLMEKKAKHLGVSVSALQQRLAAGDAELLSSLIATGVGAEAYRRSQQAPSPPSLRDQLFEGLQ
jgi:hypothetical protein